jgi:hypothetical protein
LFQRLSWLISVFVDQSHPLLFVNFLSVTSLFFRVIPANSIPGLNDIDRFFPMLLTYSPSQIIEDFLFELCARLPHSLVVIWGNIRFASQIFSILNNSFDFSLSIRLLALLSTLISKCTRTSPILVETGSHDSVSLLCRIGLTADSEYLRSQALNLIVSVVAPIKDHNDEVFNGILRVLDQNCTDLCGFVLGQESFLADSQAACTLVSMLLIPGDKPNPSILRLIMGLTDKFFDLPLHSILHCSFIRLFTALSKLGAEFHEYLRLSDLMRAIVKVYYDRDMIHASFWGHLQLIGIIINEEIELGLINAIPGWGRIRSEELIPMQEIIVLAPKCSLFMECSDEEEESDFE